jgi:hypothetical protein
MSTGSPASRILTSDNSVDRAALDAEANRRYTKVLEGVTRGFEKLRFEACATPTSHDYWNDPVFHEIEELKDGLYLEQHKLYEGVRYHVFHSRLKMGRRPLGRYDIGNIHERVPEMTTFPRHWVPSLEAYGHSLNWLLNCKRGSGRSRVMALCLLEKCLHLIKTRVSYYDHTENWHGDHMYNVLQNTIWDVDVLRSRFTLSRDTTGPWIGLNPHGATEVALFR